LLVAALFVAAITQKLLHSGLQIVERQNSLPADGRVITVAVLAARHPFPLGVLPLRATEVHITGSEVGPSSVTLRDLPHGKVAIDLRAPVEPSLWRIVERGRGGSVALTVSFTEDSHDTFSDGTPDWMRLHTAADREAFRRSFTALAEQIADTPAAKLPPEIVDCASLLRFAYREALMRHDDRWYAHLPPGQTPQLETVQQWNYPYTPLGAGLFRVHPGPFSHEDLHNGAFAQFADAKTLHLDDAYLVSRDLRAARPGDLIFYRVLEQDSQYHSMILSGEQSEWAVYHTGPVHDRQGEHPGEMRRVLLQDLVHHPDPRWRPIPGNPNFLGVYRWNILREP
jgi:uncharacterized protein YfaT (DUF1175 family)